MVRGFGGGGNCFLKILFDGGAEFGGFQGAAEALENFPLRGEKEGVGDGLDRFELVEGFGSGSDEGVVEAVSLGKNEQTSGGGFIKRDSQDNQTAWGELFM